MGLLEFLKTHQRTIVIILVMMVIYYFTLLRHDSGIYDSLITGFWTADKSFLQDAELSSFVIYMAPPNWSGKRACYILAEKGKELAINEPCSVTLAQTWGVGNWFPGLGAKTYDAFFDDLETEDFPERQKMIFYPKTGKIVLTKGDIVYGIFFKDSFLTETIYSIDTLVPEEEESD
jgi:hypothetical protein